MFAKSAAVSIIVIGIVGIVVEVSSNFVTDHEVTYAPFVLAVGFVLFCATWYVMKQNRYMGGGPPVIGMGLLVFAFYGVTADIEDFSKGKDIDTTFNLSMFGIIVFLGVILLSLWAQISSVEESDR